MKNCGGAFSAYYKRTPQPFTISNFLLHYHFALSFFNPPPTFPFLPSLQKQRTLPNSRRGGGLPRPLPRFSPLSQTPPTRTIPRPALSKIEIRAIGATTILHFSFFILHSSFFKAPPSPLSPSFLSAPFSHFLTASYCCRVYHSPTAYSLSFSCRPLSSPRFS